MAINQHWLIILKRGREKNCHSERSEESQAMKCRMLPLP